MGRGTGSLEASEVARRGSGEGSLPAILRTLEPPGIDEKWAEAIEPAAALQAQAAAKFSDARRYERFYGRGDQRSVRYRKQGEEILKKAQELYAQINAPFQAEFDRRGGWRRYIIVCNSNGHIHSQPDRCRTLIPGQTMVSPVWQLSGSDDKEVVDKFGSTACTKCFPNAPVLTASDKKEASEEKAAAKKAERAAKQREKDLKTAERDHGLAFKVEAILEKIPQGLDPYDLYNWYYDPKEKDRAKKFGDNAYYLASAIYKARNK